jgi:hypothetical protein
VEPRLSAEIIFPHEGNPIVTSLNVMMMKIRHQPGQTEIEIDSNLGWNF